MECSNNNKLLGVIKEVAGWKKADTDALCSFFENYHGGKTKVPGEKRPDILNSKLEDITADPERFVEDMVDGIRSYPNDKYKLAFRLERLVKHLRNKYDLSVNEGVFENFKYRDRNERLLKMLKYLHTAEKSRAEIASDFGISERALAQDLKTLLDGYEFMDSNMQVTRLDRKKNTYRSMIHPVFLAMNTQEIYAMTVGLKLLSRGTVFEESLGRIADATYKQLSDYAKEMVDSHVDGEKITFGDDDQGFINTEELMKRREKPFAYFLKEPIECKVTFLEKGKDAGISGTLHLADEGVSGFDKIIVQSENGRREMNIESVCKIVKIE
ncbi:MAG: hypothetical protein FH756_08465 [Firmicutes bacterium]|nr:hypothetical protein [Bacillota bacterium]